MPHIEITGSLPTTDIWIVMIFVFALAIIFQKRQAGYGFVAFEIIVLVLMIACLFVFFVPRYGW
jgi:hypothetical protein